LPEAVIVDTPAVGHAGSSRVSVCFWVAAEVEAVELEVELVVDVLGTGLVVELNEELDAEVEGLVEEELLEVELVEEVVLVPMERSTAKAAMITKSIAITAATVR